MNIPIFNQSHNIFPSTLGRTLGIRDDLMDRIMKWILHNHSKNVVRIIIPSEENNTVEDAEDSSTAFLVMILKNGTGVFLTCDHCIKETDVTRAVIRASRGRVDLNIKVLYRDKTRDCLMFQVKRIKQTYPELAAVSFCTEGIDLHSWVTVLGYSCPNLHLQRDRIRRCRLVLVRDPSPFTSTLM